MRQAPVNWIFYNSAHMHDTVYVSIHDLPIDNSHYQSVKYDTHQNGGNLLYESHQVCSEQEAAANLDQGVDICTPTPAVQCYQTTCQITYNITVGFASNLYTVSQKKHVTILLSISSPYMDRFLARDSMLSARRYMLSPVRPSVCPSVRHTGGSVENGWS